MSTGFSFGAKTTAAPTFGTGSITFGTPAAQPTQQFGFGGLSSSAPNLFGTQTAPANTTMGFGQPAPNPAPSFGSSFGAPAPNAQPGGLTFGTPASTGMSFAQAAAAPSFGAVGTAPSSFGAIGAAAPNFGAVGATAPTFGASGAAAPTFGAVGAAAPSFGAMGAAVPTFGAVGAAAPTFGAASVPSYAAAASAPMSFAAAPTASTFGTTTSTGFGAAASTGLTFGTPASSGLALGATPVSSGLSFGAPAAGGLGFGGSATTGLTLGATPASTGFGFGTSTASLGRPSTGAVGTTSGATFGTATALPSLGVSFGATSSAPSLGVSFGAATTAAPSMGLSFGAASTAAPTLNFGAAPTTGAAPGLNFGNTSTGGLNFGLSATSSASSTGLGLSLTTSTAQPNIGLGGIASTQTKTGTTAAAQKEVPPREQLLPNEFLQLVDQFKNVVQSEKNRSSDVARCSVKEFHKVETELDLLNHQFNQVENQLQNNRHLAEQLKFDTAKGLQNIEMAQRTQDTPAGLQYDNTAPLQFFLELANNFERDMQLLKLKIDNTEKFVNKCNEPNVLTSQDLALGMRRLHETFVALAGRMQSVHSQVEHQKEVFLSLRKQAIKDNINPFETNKTADSIQAIVRNTTRVAPPLLATGPTPFNSVALGSNNLSLLGQQTPAPTFAPTTTTSLGFSMGPSTTGFGQAANTSLFGSSGFGQQSQLNASTSFQLQKPPTGNKRGKQ